jgi:hypothetical protein
MMWRGNEKRIHSFFKNWTHFCINAELFFGFKITYSKDLLEERNFLNLTFTALPSLNQLTDTLLVNK